MLRRISAVSAPAAETERWRHAENYSYLRGIDRAGLMWEWLRREPAYLEWYATASRVTGGTAPDPLQWGLHFR